MAIKTPKNVDTLDNGRRYTNESLQTLLANFASGTAPSSSDYIVEGVNTTPPLGALWYDTTNSVLRVQTATGTWKQAYIPQVGSPLGTSYAQGELVYDTTANKLKLRDNTTTLKTLLTQGVAIDSTPIGSSTASTGAFTTLSASTSASFKNVTETQASVSSSSGTLTINLALANVFYLDMSENITSLTITRQNISGYTAESFILHVTQDTTPRTITWTGVQWAGGTAPSLSTSGVDIFAFFYIDGVWYGFEAGKDMS